MATKVKFLKAHGKYGEGDEATIDDAQANYFVRCKVAEEVDQEKTPTKKAPTKKK